MESCVEIHQTVFQEPSLPDHTVLLFLFNTV